jgi:hypothetical protein
MADLTVILDISNSLGPGLGLRLPAPTISISQAQPLPDRMKADSRELTLLLIVIQLYPETFLSVVPHALSSYTSTLS